MATTRQTGQWLLALSMALGCLNGCSSTPTASTQTHDPLHGVTTPPGMPVPNSASKTSNPTTSLPNPALQQPGHELTSTNNATLANMSGSQLLRPLAIDNDGRVQPTGQLTSGSWAKPGQAPPGYPGYNPNPRVEKVPDIEPTTSRSSPPQAWQAPPGAQPTNVAPPANVPAAVTPTDALTRQLQERGVTSQKIDPLPNGVHLTCYIQRPNAAPRILEATAIDFAEAAQAILHQLDNTR
jgi:hypothetical protein